MSKAYLEELPSLIGKHYMTIIIESPKKKRIHIHIDQRQQMIISKNDIINIILLIIELKVLNIQAFMEIIHLKNSFYMINRKFIVLIIKLDLVPQSQLLHLFLDMVDMFQPIDSNIIWIILKIPISIPIKLIIYLIIWLEFLIIRDMFLKVLLISREIKDHIAFQQKVKTFLKLIKINKN